MALVIIWASLLLGGLLGLAVSAALRDGVDPLRFPEQALFSLCVLASIAICPFCWFSVP